MGLCIFWPPVTPQSQGLCYSSAHVIEASEMKFRDISSTIQAIDVPLLPKAQTACLMFSLQNARLAFSVRGSCSPSVLLDHS